VNKKSQLAFAAFTYLVDANETVLSLLRYQLKLFGLTMSQFRTLAALLHEGVLSQAALSKKVHRTDADISIVVANLVKRGWVVRRAHRGDKRKVMVQLTPEGQKKIAKVFPRHVKVVRAQMAALKPREQEILRRLCRKLDMGNPMKFCADLTLVDEDDLAYLAEARQE
jgi:MarR family 2-MHQ and catechol resistance regulon transcriptional repressor